MFTDMEPKKESKQVENPVGALQEMCVSRRWSLPNYELVKREGVPHKFLFTFVCVVNRYQETGKL
jgi:RISC-loading complex subunit TARBP2